MTIAALTEVILAGRPNSGKSTLFNRLASARQKVGNYAGCTVEKKTALVTSADGVGFEITDLPGIYSLKANSLDEEVALRHLEEKRASSRVVFVLDGNNLEQELVLPLLLKKRGFDLTVAVNMMDEVRANKRILDLTGMTDLAGIPFFPISAKSGEGVEALKKFLGRPSSLAGKTLAAEASPEHDLPEEHRRARSHAKELNRLNKGPRESAMMARDSRFDSVLLHPIVGPVVFFLTMFVLFQSIFTWAAPVSDFVEAGIKALADIVKANLSNELLVSLVNDGILAGLGSVLVFVPQIAILFFLIGLLEYSGYLPRVAYMVDRLMKPYGLDGKVFIPMLSSVACAVPGIMSTRTIESERTRLITIMISPLMTCSARLPVYTLLIGTFVPARQVGPLSLAGLVMFAMYVLSVVVALLVALVLHKLNFGNRKHLVDFLHLPHYRSPNWPELLRFVWSRVFSFLRKAGTIIFAMAVLLWALLSFPSDYPGREELHQKIEAQSALATSAPSVDAQKQLATLEARDAAHKLENSLGGRIGKTLEPMFRPIGYDWKLTIGILASLAAREVFVATIGTVFSLGAAVGDDTTGLSEALLAAKKPDGSPAYTLATCLSLLVFFAFSLQCISTIGVAKRETNSWKIPAIMFVYMFVIAYFSAFAAYWGTIALMA